MKLMVVVIFLVAFVIGGVYACVEHQISECEKTFNPEEVKLLADYEATTTIQDKNRVIREICSTVKTYLQCLKDAGVQKCGTSTERTLIATLKKYDDTPYLCDVRKDYKPTSDDQDDKKDKEEGGSSKGLYIGGGIGGVLFVLIIIGAAYGVRRWCCDR